MKTMNYYLTKNKIPNKAFLSIFILFGAALNAQNVNIPDANFKQALLDYSTVIDTNNDGEISYAEAAAYSGMLILNDNGISDLTGIDAFTTITRLYVDNNNLSTLNLSSNSLLTFLRCENNQLTSINVSSNSILEVLVCSENQLTSLNVSSNPVLSNLTFSNNQLTNIDVSSNLLLKNLVARDNLFTSINLSSNPMLENLIIDNNQLSNLDISSNSMLKTLSVNNNELTNIDVSSNPDLIGLTCSDNQLTSLNAANGNNSEFIYFDALNNNLVCIQIDSDFTPPTDGSWKKDNDTEYSDHCENMSISDFDEYNTSVYPNPVKDILHIQAKEDIQEIRLISATGEYLKTLKGQNYIDFTTYPKGVYFIQVKTMHSIITEKVIKLK